MQKLTVLDTIEKIEKLIDENSGDIGRLEHIVDFLKKEKPLYNTDRIYLESKINAEIIFEEKIIKKESETEQIKKLTESGKGDPISSESASALVERASKQLILGEYRPALESVDLAIERNQNFGQAWALKARLVAAEDDCMKEAMK